MSKQDRQGVRTATGLEQKYNFGKSFTEIRNIATDAQEVAHYAAESVIGLDGKLDHEEIFNRLTNNGELKGIYMGDDGELYINATYIKSGEFLADLIKAGVIRSKDGTSVVIDLDNGNAELTGNITTKTGTHEGVLSKAKIAPGYVQVSSDTAAEQATLTSRHLGIINDNKGDVSLGVSMVMSSDSPMHYESQMSLHSLDDSGKIVSSVKAFASPYRSCVTGLTTPVDDSDAVNKDYADDIERNALSYAQQEASDALGSAKDYADDAAGQALADAQSYTDTEMRYHSLALTAGLSEVRTFANKRIVHNYLDNSDFSNPVNQRGLTSYTAAGYTIDRWVNSTKYGTINVLSGAVSKSGSGTLYQHMEGLDPAKTYTAAVCLDDGTLNVQSGVLSNTIGSSSKGLTVNYTASTGIATFLIGPGSSAETKYKWAALYEGTYTAETLPPYVPKGYATELAECMRYYYQSWTGSISTSGCLTREAFVTSRLHNVEFPIPMRATPTITIYKCDGTANAVGEYVSGTAVTSVSVVYSTNKSFIPSQASSAFKAGTVYAFHYSASADL